MKEYKIYILWIILLMTLVGVIDSAVIYLRESGSVYAPCFVVTGCDKVINSPYSHIFGVPLGLIGFLVYSSLFILVSIYINYKNRIAFNLFRLGVVVGTILSLYLIYLQAFVIKGFCSYCLVSSIDMLIMLVVIIYLGIKRS